MTTPKLSEPQKRALNVLATDDVHITTWGGDVFGFLPDGIKSRATLGVLRRLGFAQVERVATRVKFGASPPPAAKR